MQAEVKDKPKIQDDEFDIHGDLSTEHSEDGSFVVLYDSAQKDATAPAKQNHPTTKAPSLDEIDESQAMKTSGHGAHSAYSDEILSSEDLDDDRNEIGISFRESATVADASRIDTTETPDSDFALDEDGPIALTDEELDGILESGPDAEENFHPDFPVESEMSAPPLPLETTDEPDALNLTESAPHSEPLSDDDGLPIALSDEDLEEVLLEEKSVQSSKNQAPEDDFSIDDNEVDEEEPIALSDDELDNILADAEAVHTPTEGKSAATVSPAAHEDEDELIQLSDDSEMDFLAEENSKPLASPEAEPAGFFDSEEDEPITLSDEELDGILSDSNTEATPPAQTEEQAISDMPDDGVVEIHDDEPVALSSEELDGILADAHEVPAEDGDLSEMPVAEENLADSGTVDQHSDFFSDSSDDEPVALSQDELDGILSTVTEEETAETVPAAIDERYADVDALPQAEPEEEQPTELPHDEDEGPIALSPDELEGIAADAHEVTPEAPMVSLNENAASTSEPSIAEQTEKPSVMLEEDLEASTLIHEDEAAQSANTPDKEELKSVLGYLDNLLGELPDDVIEKFAQSDYFKLYQKIMDKLGI